MNPFAKIFVKTFAHLVVRQKVAGLLAVFLNDEDVLTLVGNLQATLGATAFALEGDGFTFAGGWGVKR